MDLLTHGYSVDPSRTQGKNSEGEWIITGAQRRIQAKINRNHFSKPRAPDFNEVLNIPRGNPEMMEDEGKNMLYDAMCDMLLSYVAKSGRPIEYFVATKVAPLDVPFIWSNPKVIQHCTLRPLFVGNPDQNFQFKPATYAEAAANELQVSPVIVPAVRDSVTTTVLSIIDTERSFLDLNSQADDQDLISTSEHVFIERTHRFKDITYRSLRLRQELKQAVVPHSDEILNVTVKIPLVNDAVRSSFTMEDLKGYLSLPEIEGCDNPTLYIPHGIGKTTLRYSLRQCRIFESHQFPGNYRNQAVFRHLGKRGFVILTNRIKDLDPKHSVVLMPSYVRFMSNTLARTLKTPFEALRDYVQIMYYHRSRLKNIPDSVTAFDLLIDRRTFSVMNAFGDC